MKLEKITNLFKRQTVEDERNKYVVDPNAEPDPDEVLRMHDRESRTRVVVGPWKIVITIVSIVFVLYHLFTSRFGTPTVMAHRAIHVGFILLLTFMYYPASKKSNKSRPSAVDMIFLTLIVATTIYTAWNVVPLALRASTLTEL